jgi:membrane fusion protein (multidrug efflux system)
MDAVTPKEIRAERPQDDRPTRKRDEADERAREEPLDEAARKTTWMQSLRRRPWLIAAIAVGLVIVIAAAVVWWLHARQYESTDDAFIDTRIVAITPQVSGAISDVQVTDNQLVEAGTVLMRLDDRIYQAQVEQAKAQVDQAQANIDNLNAQLDAQQARIEQADKQVVEAQAALTFARQESERYQQLAKTNAGTVQQAQQARSNLIQSEAAFGGAQANAVAARKQLAVLRTQRQAADAALEVAQAQLKLAEINLSYTVIKAPVAGRVTKLTAAKGIYAAPGQALSMFVPREIWITANFKETQLTYMQPGQPVDISIDAFPNRKFTGHIDSIQAGSGTAFSLLPAENATGNFVKVVQRVPVKIVFEQTPEVELGPGMSVVPTVKVQ